MPNILVTNDDGINAPGIAALVEVAKQFGNVTVVAPDSPQSGQGHAITLKNPLRLKKVNVFKDTESYQCDGTPADCVKLAKYVIFKEQEIDLCVSGINHGSNASLNIIYSGTMSAAMEASIDGIPSIGFSLDDFSFTADFEASKQIAKHIIGQVLNNKVDTGNLINVNIPKLPYSEIKGIKVCTQGDGRWEENFQEGTDPYGGKYYWLTGEFHLNKEEERSDILALRQGYVSVVPSWHDLTNKKALDSYSFLEL